MKRSFLYSLVSCVFISFSLFGPVSLAADPNEDVLNTKHNLSVTGPGTLKASTETRVCVFCHTPHGSTVSPNAPLWNRTLSTDTYTEYNSDSLQATLEQPSGSAKLCLSCHDGALVIGNVNYAYGNLNASFTMDGTAGDGTFTDEGATTGFTRNLGTNLTNDHPISFTFDSALATADAELYDPTLAGHLGNRVRGEAKATIPLEDDKVQCISCHNPHTTNEKFLRLNRNQKNAGPTEGSFDENNDIICLACHNKAGWAQSVHANTAVADETYTTAASEQRQFTAGIQVWQAACLNCHDTHTVPGAKMLLREGTDSTETPKQSGAAAQEETCYQCHTVNGGVDNILNGGVDNEVPDIKSEFSRLYHKPISNTDQGVTEEKHSIQDKDFIEDAANLGTHRHAECTDCHNPHRIIKNQQFNDDPSVPGDVAHHKHDLASGEMHSNILSGALAGSWGVEPVYGGTDFGTNPVSFDVKSGYAGSGASTDKSASHVTREYQICLKCHSNYAYGNSPPTSGPSIGHNGLTQYTNQAMEFQAPEADKGEKVSGSTGADANHRSWHPVMEPTGRTATIRGGLDPTVFNQPWQDDGVERIGNQTMYCSDCHGSSIPFVEGDTSTYTVEPASDAAWGPHGSDDPFILKGQWDHNGTVAAAESSQLCFRCHNMDQYSPATSVTKVRSGFSGPGSSFGSDHSNLHIKHAGLVGRLRCTWCHVAVPHGWRNKQLLVNLAGDPEAAAAGCDQTVGGNGPSRNYIQTPCDGAPYYQKAYLGGNPAGVNWRVSGEWTSSDCGGGCGGWMSRACGNPQ